MNMNEEDDELKCPHCGESNDAYETYMESGAQANEGALCCLSCGEEVDDDDWIQS